MVRNIIVGHVHLLPSPATNKKRPLAGAYSELTSGRVCDRTRAKGDTARHDARYRLSAAGSILIQGVGRKSAHR
jgi:hypothetical protein